MSKRSFRLSDSTPDAARDVADELAFHLEMRTREFIEQGMNQAEAERAAAASFGDVPLIRSGLTQQRSARNAWRARREWWLSIWSDIRYGTRVLRRTPFFSAVAVLSIGAGLAAGTAIFALGNAWTHRSVGGSDEAMYRIFTSSHSHGLYNSSSYADYESFRTLTNMLAATCATERVRANIRADGTDQSHHGEIVSPGCFDALQLAPPVGRYFSEDQAMAATPTPIVISHALWLRRFGGDPSVVGRTVLLNGMTAAVAGVAPKGFAGTLMDGSADFWAPVQVAPVVLPPGTLSGRGARMFTIYARLREGVSREQAEAALAVVAAQLRRVDEEAWTNKAGDTRTVSVLPEINARFAGGLATPGAILLQVVAAIGVIIAIACLNLATMLMARGAARARELSIRLAIGASRARVLRQLATESLLIAALGAAAALATVAIGLRVFNAYRPVALPAFDVALDARVVTFTVVLAVVASLLFGLAPAVHTLRLALADGLKGRLFAARARRIRVRAREALIVVQVAVSIALLLVSVLFVRAWEHRTTVSPGFNTANVTVVPAHLDAIADSDRVAVTARILQAAAAVPQVEQIALAGLIPLTGSSIGFEVIGGDGSEQGFLGNIVSPGYFATLEIPVRAGRDFDGRDGPGGANVAIVSETLAQRVWGTTHDAIGRSLVVDGRTVEVVGVVADIRYRSLSEPFRPLLYLPIAQTPRTRFVVHARVRGGREHIAALESAVRTAEPRVTIDGAQQLRAHMQAGMAAERAAQWIGGIVGVIQLGLALMALWGLVAYAVERRTQEMAVRLALGARPSSLVQLTMRSAGVSIVIGVAIGCIIGTIIARVVQANSFGLPPLDLRAVVPFAIAFTFVAMIAAWWPARRVGMADPAACLRRE